MKHNILSISFLSIATACLFIGCANNKSENIEVPANNARITDSVVSQNIDTISPNICATTSFTEVRRPDMKKHVRKGSALLLETEGFQLAAVDTAVLHTGTYSVTSLYEEEMPALPQGMINMTAATAGYRLLPGGDHFSPYAELRVAYTPERLPFGYTPDDIYTSYFDTTSMAWVRLERVEVDTVNHEIVSLTTHFTDFINELLKAPEMPETQAFVPTAMNDLEAVSPMDGLSVIQPPTANNNGTANLSYPIVIPAGRGGMQPNLTLTYSSTGGSGWLGVGWDIPVPSITLDTRWGVPRYNAVKETEIYLLDGEQLITKEAGGTPRPMPHRTNQQTDRLPDGTQFYARTGDAHDSIIRHGDSTTNYWWEVVDRNGITHYYGHYVDSSRWQLPATLCDNNNNIARWPLCESRDLYGNTVRYYYDHATVINHGAEGRQLYLDSISYTGHNDIDGYYTVVFCRMANLTTDIPTNCNNGFKEITDQLLNNVYVKGENDILTAWLFDFENIDKSNFKNRIITVAKIDSAANGMRNFLSSRCNCVQPDEDEDSLILYTVDSVEIKDTLTGSSREEPQVMYRYDTTWYSVVSIPEIEAGYAGSSYHFSYYDAPAINNMFGPEKEYIVSSKHLHGVLLTDSDGSTFVSQATGLGLSHSSSWNIGGTASVGFGPVICLTTTSLGGSYTRGQSASESLMTLVDLDGDGLADKVYVSNGNVYYQKNNGGGDSISYEDPVIVRGMSHFLQESNYSNTFGVQLAVGFSGSASWTNSKSTTSTYLADVNGDGLVDLVNNGQVFFNSLDSNNHPSFSLYVGVRNSSNEYISDSIPVQTSTSHCNNGIIFDGKVDDSITCERIWACYDSISCDTAQANEYVAQYLANPDTLALIDSSVVPEPGYLSVKFYHYEWDCSYHDDSPKTEAVRVWVAPYDGTIQLSSEVKLLKEDSLSRMAAKHADGVNFIIQHSHDIDLFSDSIHANSNNILCNKYFCDTCYYEDDPNQVYHYDSTFMVLQGDMIFFRLNSIENQQFDNVMDHHTITYTDYGSVFDSERDFVLTGNYCFQAPANGFCEISVDFIADTEKVLLEVSIGDSVTRHTSSSISRSDSIDKDSTICFTVRAKDFASPQWGQVICKPHITFYPDTDFIRIDTNDFTHSIDSSRYTNTVEGWIPCHLDIQYTGCDTIYNNTLLQGLFGPLYNGWGQFAYHSLDTGSQANYIKVDKLVPPNLFAAGVSDASDSTELDNELHGGDNLDSTALSNDSIQQNDNLYNPISAKSYWVEMTPDVEHQAWVSYGRQNLVRRDSISNSLQVQWYSSAADITTDTIVDVPINTTYDDPVPAATKGMPAKAVRKVNQSKSQSWSIGAAGAGVSGSKGTNTVVTDYMDLNGDRYPDNIGLDRIQYSQQWGGIGELRNLPSWHKEKNNSLTFSAGLSYSASQITQEREICGSQGEALFTLSGGGSGSVSGGGNIGRDKAHGAWMDINADGLPDFITEGGDVYLNIGYDFLYDKNWKYDNVRKGISGSISEGVNVSIPDEFFNVWQGSIQAGAGISASYNQTTAMFVDMNGDGLPDMVWRNPSAIVNLISGCNNNDTYVKFNLGNGEWSHTENMDIHCFHKSTNYSESLNMGLTYGFTLWGAFKVTVGVDGSPYSGSVNRDHIQLVDVNADGLPDLVSSDDEYQLTVRYNQGGQTNLLRKVTNFNNADFEIEYALSKPDYNQPSRSWLMTKVTTNDALNGNNGATTTVTEYAYANPHYDRYERTSYGYGKVTTSHIDPVSDSAYRKIDRDYYNNNMLRRGKLKSELTYVDSNELYVEKTHECTYIDYTHGDTLNVDTLCPSMAYPVVEATFTKFYEGGTTPLFVVGERTEYDRYHNVSKYFDLGDTSDASDGLMVEFHYYTGVPNNLVGLRQDYTVSPIGSSTALRKAKFEYDFAHGKLTRQVLCNDTDSSVYDFVYEPTYGNLDTAIQPLNDSNQRMTYHYEYDNTVHTYPTRIFNSYGETMSTSYDYRFGKPLTVTDPTGSTMVYRYDFAGRLVSVNSPMNISGTPSLVNQYHPMNYYQNGLNPQGYTFSASPTGHPYTVSKHYDDNGDLVTETAVLINGFGQAIQTKKGLRVGSTNKMQVSGRTVVDAYGRTVEQYDPVAEDSSTHRGEYNANYDVNSLTSTTYDVLDRTKDVAMPLGVTTHTVYGIGNDAGGHRRFYTRIIDPNGYTTHQYSDYDGHQVQVTDANNGITLMQYDNLGQLVSASDPEGFTTSYAYDMLGRMTKRIHPDAGITQYDYDPAGNITKETNSLGEIYYDYIYYRPKHKRYFNMSGNNVTYTYGDSGPETGRLVRIVDGSGMYECKYDKLGNVTDETRTIAMPHNDDEVYSFHMDYSYDSWGRMNRMVYPDGEEITYSYQWGGDLNSMNGNKNGDDRTYIREIQYNSFGQKEQVNYGNGTSAQYTYDALHRLAHLQSTDSLGNLMQNIDYTFDNASNITFIEDSAGVVNSLGGGHGNNYHYDNLHRLTHSDGGGVAGNYDMDMAYTPSGRIIWKHRNAQSSSV